MEATRGARLVALAGASACVLGAGVLVAHRRRRALSDGRAAGGARRGFVPWCRRAAGAERGPADDALGDARWARGVADVERDGFAVVPGALGEEERLAALEEVLLRMAEVRQGEHPLVMGRNKGRFDVVMPSLASERFEWLHRRAPWLSCVRQLVGEDAVVLFMGVIWTEPGAEQGGWHADGCRLFSRHSRGAALPPLPAHCVNVFVPLVDVTPEARNGPTEFVPGTHADGARWWRRWWWWPRRPPAPVKAYARAGDALIFDVRVLHRGLANESGTPRPVLYATMGASWYRDVTNWPEVVRKFFSGLTDAGVMD